MPDKRTSRWWSILSGRDTWSDPRQTISCSSSMENWKFPSGWIRKTSWSERMERWSSLTIAKMGRLQWKSLDQPLMVDGLGVGDIGQVVFVTARSWLKRHVRHNRHRWLKDQQGHRETPGNKPRLHLRQRKFDLVNAQEKVEEIIDQKTTPGEVANWDYVKKNIRESVGHFSIWTQTSSWFNL